MRRLPALMLLTALLCGCPQDIGGLDDDADADASSVADGGTGDAGTVWPFPGFDAGGADGGTSGGTDAGSGDAGGTNDAGAPSFDLRWAEHTLPTGATHGLYAVHGTAPNDVFAGGSNGNLLHYAGSGWKLVGRLANGSNLRGMWVSPTRQVFIAAGSSALSCESNCTNEESYRSTTFADCNLVAACGNGATVWLLGTRTDFTSCGLRYTGNHTWSRELALSSSLSAGMTRCHVAADGALYFTAQWRIVKVEGGGGSEEPTDITSSEKFSIELHGVHGTGGELFAV
ncbi:MAG: hypothetical protein ACK4N5_27440, partial [Myxococcales bacterium]